MLNAADVNRYLARLGLAHPGPPTVAALRALTAAHVERVPYEALEIHLGRPTTVDPYESVARVLLGRGGYCFHLNGAFATLLASLGYRVTWHVGGVHADPSQPAPGADANHLTLTVECEGGHWLVDVGLGDALHEPLPLRAGGYRQGPFTLRLRPSEVVPGGWRLDHDEHGSFSGMDFSTAPAGPADFAAKHHFLSTSPESPFVRILTAQRRDARGADVLRGAVLSRVEGAGPVKEVELTTAEEWFGVLGGVFGLTLAEVPAADREALWERVRRSHLAWRAAQPVGSEA
ncbi:arylamine N-acetyltransferase family protein [Kitasatospora sp. NPDC004240]